MNMMRTTKSGGNGWDKYGYHVLEELKQFNYKIDKMQCDITDLKKDVEGVKVKAGTWGAIMGAIVASVANIVIALIK